MVLWSQVALARKLRNMMFFSTKLRLRPCSAAQMGCTERVPKHDMHGMERFEIYLGCKVSYELNSAIFLFRPDGVPLSRQRLSGDYKLLSNMINER